MPLFETVPMHQHYLPPGVRIEDVVRRTRNAAAAFLQTAALGWGRTKLRSWLIVEYGMATEWTREDEVAPWLNPEARMEDDRIQSVVEEVRKRIIRMLVEAARVWGAPEFAKEMIDRGMLTCVTDSSGRDAYAPAARVDLGLLERVASLFIADFLMHPSDYEEVVWCECCGEMALNGRLRHGRGCLRQSGMRPKAESGVSLREGVVSSLTSCDPHDTSSRRSLSDTGVGTRPRRNGAL